MTLESVGPNSMQAGLTESACRSPTHLIDANASSSAVSNDRDFKFADCSGSKREPLKALATVGRSHVGTMRNRGGLSLLEPFRNRTTKLFLPTDGPAIGACEAAMAAT